ncbi:hypothetical protein AC579_1307 [Pseudocercospora musae]|uniref:Uncharacterized protein n=1 Tax=Pseudocercospora musae TaxID=113226 RepID=A0A139I6A8_9PEZI|nr:hypothetical protein AC579_1307 [Pseudocercospora musae]KXT10284.1 hypothetical protein AC579_1307 [Pseudocercospora musae]KXT10287.1 hypothetical protein AC579_1307 [Pseudocercospora musae]KXT10290.1 hypothetical protein AC579_1307 [Pseudocercospora musae]
MNLNTYPPLQLLVHHESNQKTLIDPQYRPRPNLREKCQREARATAKKEKEAKKQDSKRKAKADSISWFKDNSKEREKRRTEDDDSKGPKDRFHALDRE